MNVGTSSYHEGGTGALCFSACTELQSKLLGSPYNAPLDNPLCNPSLRSLDYGSSGSRGLQAVANARVLGLRGFNHTWPSPGLALNEKVV